MPKNANILDRFSAWVGGVASFTRICWVEGGRWERFFILVYPAWAIYFGALHVWSLLLVSTLYTRLTLYFIGILFLVLHPVWRTPLLTSERIIRSLVANGTIKGDENRKDALTFADYLGAWGTRGRWMFGFLMSLITFVFYVGVGILFLTFTLLLGELSGILLAIPLLLSFVVVMWLYNRGIRRFLDDMTQRGYPIRREGRLAGW